MAKRSVNTNVTRPSFVADPHSLMRSNGGRQIDWDLVAERARVGAFQVAVDTGGANPAATTVPVVALEGPVPSGTVLNFGEANFTVTVGAGGALAAATSVPVVALPGPLQAGTLLDFGSDKFARLSADAAAGATSIATDAIPTALAGAETATASGQKYAQTTADADEGDTSLTVEALKVGLDAGDEATVLGADAEAGLDKFIPAGTVMSELSTGKVVPRSMRPGSEAAKYIMETNANENSKSDSLSGYGMLLGGVVLENLLPDADPSTGLIPSGYKTELAAAGTGFAYEVYNDSRGD
jgi:hypothetical protein